MEKILEDLKNLKRKDENIRSKVNMFTISDFMRNKDEVEVKDLITYIKDALFYLYQQKNVISDIFIKENALIKEIEKMNKEDVDFYQKQTTWIWESINILEDLYKEKNKLNEKKIN